MKDGSVVSAVEWFEGGFAGALERAGAEDRLVLADVGAYWCEPCRELDETVFTHAEVGAYVGERFVAVHIDAEKADGPELVERYHVQVYPTLLVLEASGVEKGRLLEVEGPTSLMQDLDTIASGGNVLEELEAEIEAAPDDLEKVYALASRHAQAANRERAESLFERVLVGDPDNARGLAAKVMYDRAMFFDFKIDGDPEKAVASYRALQQRFPASKESERAHRQIGRALASLGDDDGAIASLEAMLAIRPDDPDLYVSYGWFSFRQKCRPDAGLVAVRRGVELAPERAELHYLAAELHHLLGDDGSARVSIRRALEIEPISAYYKRQSRRFEGLARGGANASPSSPGGSR